MEFEQKTALFTLIGLYATPTTRTWSKRRQGKWFWLSVTVHGHRIGNNQKIINKPTGHHLRNKSTSSVQLSSGSNVTCDSPLCPFASSRSSVGLPAPRNPSFSMYAQYESCVHSMGKNSALFIDKMGILCLSIFLLPSALLFPSYPNVTIKLTWISHECEDLASRAKFQYQFV